MLSTIRQINMRKRLLKKLSKKSTIHFNCDVSYIKLGTNSIPFVKSKKVFKILKISGTKFTYVPV